MRTVRVTFDEICRKGRRIWTENGKRRVETVKFRQTVNPFNTNAFGLPKTVEQIRKEVGHALETWIAEAPDGERRFEVF